MQRFVLAVVMVLMVGATAAADTLASWTFSGPKDWQRAEDADHVIWMKTADPDFCMVAVYKPRALAGAVADEVAQDWKTNVESTFTVSAATKPAARKTKGKLAQSSRSASLADTEGHTFYGTLHVVSGKGTVGSVLVVATTSKFMKTCAKPATALIDSITVSAAPAAPPPTAPVTSDPGKAAGPLVGRWAKGASGTRDPTTGMTFAGSVKMEYVFGGDGTYTFHSEAWGGHANSTQYYVVHETGTWSGDGALLTVTPKTITGEVRDASGKVVKTAKPAKETTTYRWQSVYFEGLQETQLVLTVDKETTRDGAYASNSAYPSSYMYSAQYKPEWKFPY